MSNDFQVLNGSGTVSRVEMEQIVGGKYERILTQKDVQQESFKLPTKRT